MDPITALLVGVLAPALVAVAVAVTLHVLVRDPASRWSALGAPLGLAAGYGVGFELILGWPALPPVDVTQVSPWLGLIAVVVAVAVARPRGMGPAARAIVSLALGVAIGVWLVVPLVPHALSTGLALLHVVAIAVSFVAIDLGLTRALGSLEPAAGAGTIAAVAGGSAAAILLSDVASLGQVTGGLAAAAGALAVLGLVRPRALHMRSAALVVAAIVVTNLWSAVLYAAGGYEVVALITLAPLAVVAARRWLVSPRRMLVRAVLPAALVTVVVGAAAGIAASRYFAASHDDAASGQGAVVPDTASDDEYGY